MLEDSIQKQNRLPGCEQYTRPEEIKVLGKYLKSLRKFQEDNTKLDTEIDWSPSKSALNAVQANGCN